VRKIYISALNSVPFLPYVHGLLRATVSANPELSSAYEFGDPAFYGETVAEVADRFSDADVVGLSCYVWNYRRHVKLARILKERRPETTIVVGGPHVPDRAEAFLREHPYIDIAVHGEGELVFAGILRESLKERPDFATIAGLSYRDRGLIRNTGTGLRFGKAIDLPSPYLSGYLDEPIARCRRLGLRPYALWETNRGCPYSCSFCDWGSATMSKIRLFALDQLMADIAFFAASEINTLFICDANFGILARDLEVAERIAATNAETGWPKQVRVNFAKNSNDRVFSISKLFHDREMSMGTTLSMQSTDESVLTAIARSNIGVENYRKLQRRYAAASIPTYTELILGLPLETRQTFVKGIGEVIESGNHDDIRVFELTLLPNAPMSNDGSVDRYGLRTIEKNVYLRPPKTPPDELETAVVVTGTSTMDGEEWIFCRVFAELIQTLHNGCITRYAAMFARRVATVPFETFYVSVMEWAMSNPETVLGRVVGALREVYSRYRESTEIPQLQVIASQPSLTDCVSQFGRRTGWRPDQWAWLCIAAELDSFYSELEAPLRSLGVFNVVGGKELLAFQKDIILRPEFDPDVGKIVRYSFDFPRFFGGGDLISDPVEIEYLDTHMGSNHQFPLRKDDLLAFASAAVGMSYPFIRVRHFQHQLSTASIQRESARRNASKTVNAN